MATVSAGKDAPLATDIGRSFCDASAARLSRAARDARASSSAVGVGELEVPRSACKSTRAPLTTDIARGRSFCDASAARSPRGACVARASSSGFE